MKRTVKPTPARVRRAIAVLQGYLEEIECGIAIVTQYGTSFHKSSIEAINIDEIQQWQQHAKDAGIVRPRGSSEKQE